MGERTVLHTTFSLYRYTDKFHRLTCTVGSRLRGGVNSAGSHSVLGASFALASD